MAIVRPIPYQIDLNTRIRTNPRIVATVGDKDSLTLQVSLTVNGNEFNLTGWKVYFKALLPNQENFILDDSIVIKDAVAGSFEYTFNTAAFSVPGQIKDAMFMLTKGNTPDQIAHSFYFAYEVKSDPTIGYLQAESFVSDYERFKDELKDLMQDSFDNANAALANSQHAIEEVEAAEGRIDELEEQIQNAQIVKKSDTNNWQKFPITTIDGLPYSTNSITDWHDMLTINAGRVAVNASLLSTNAPPEGLYFDVTIFRRTKTTGHIEAVDMINNTKWIDSLSGTGWAGWIKQESTTGSAQKVADLKAMTQNVKLTLDSGANKRQSSIDLNNLFEPGHHYVSGNDTLNKPANFGNGYVDVFVGNIDSATPSGYYKHIYYEYGTNRVAIRDRKQNAATKTTWTDWSIKGKVLLWSGTANKSSTTQTLSDSLSNYPYVGIYSNAGEGNSPSKTIFKNTGANGYVLKSANIADAGDNATLWSYEARVFVDSPTFKTFTIDLDNRVTSTGGAANKVDSGNYTTVYEIWGMYGDD